MTYIVVYIYILYKNILDIYLVIYIYASIYTCVYHMYLFRMRQM